MILPTTLFNPTSWLLEVVHNFVGNWRWSIIILTNLINIVIITFQAPFKKNASRLKRLEPRLIAIKQSFADNPHEINKATVELYRKENIDPLSGCILLLTVMLLRFSLYWGIWSSVNMVGAPWVLWIKDLSSLTHIVF